VTNAASGHDTRYFHSANFRAAEETAPFYVDGAWPGDTLVVTLNRVRLIRETAVSGDQIIPSALGPRYYRDQKFDDRFSSDWTLGRAAGIPIETTEFGLLVRDPAGNVLKFGVLDWVIQLHCRGCAQP
jgi:hypothetical protein